ncbi:hypothetical protein SPKIRA_37400 (plasmid) [Sphingomonas paucimobilis]|nr:hypothetical protein SPKIRA_37400 [Sphingomonas paucimobilis]
MQMQDDPVATSVESVVDQAEHCVFKLWYDDNVEIVRGQHAVQSGRDVTHSIARPE